MNHVLARMHWYLAWSILRARRFKIVQIKSVGLCKASPRGLNFYIVIYREMLKHFLFKNHLANFNQTWQETCLGDGDSDLFK